MPIGALPTLLHTVMYPCGGGSQGAQQSRGDTPNAGHDDAARRDGRDVERDVWPSTGPLDPKTTSQREPPPVLLPKSSNHSDGENPARRI